MTLLLFAAILLSAVPGIAQRGGGPGPGLVPGVGPGAGPGPGLINPPLASLKTVTPPAPAGAERYVAESGLDWTIVKPSLIWGPRDGFFNIVAGLVRMSPVIVPVPGDGKARFHVGARAPLAALGRAVIEIDPSVFKRLPFDEPAPESRTFSVPPTIE